MSKKRIFARVLLLLSLSLNILESMKYVLSVARGNEYDDDGDDNKMMIMRMMMIMIMMVLIL